MHINHMFCILPPKSCSYSIIIQIWPNLHAGDVIGVGPSGLTVLDEAKYRERRESAGVFTAIPSLLRCVKKCANKLRQSFLHLASIQC